MAKVNIVRLDKMLSLYRVTSAYGPRIHPITGAKSIHSGIDMAKDHKSAVLALIPGTVVKAAFHSSYGNKVIIQDKNKNTQVYAHLDSISVKVGAKVEVGQEVGRQGTTGSSTGSHLHYEVRIDGLYAKHTDPIKYTREYWAENIDEVGNSPVVITEPDLGPITVAVNGYKIKGLAIAGVSMVPVSSIAQALGKTTSWNAQNKIVTID